MPTRSPLSNGPVDSTRSGKGSDKSLIVTLPVSPAALAKFAPKASASQSGSQSKASSSSSTSTPGPLAAPEHPTDTVSDQNSTPGPAVTPNGSSSAGDGNKRKRQSSPKSGGKKSNLLPDGTIKPKGKPGPKKKPRLDDGTIDHGDGANRGSTAAALGGHKLGPKANQGAINAGLRALDRSGKPCRKWEKKRFTLKSFTGVTWDVPTWRTPKPTTIDSNAPANQEATPAPIIGGNGKENKESSTAASEKSNANGEGDITHITPPDQSSPAPVVVASA